MHHHHLSVRFEAAASKKEIPPDEYRALIRGLNAKQGEVVMYNRDWCKKLLLLYVITIE